jgi:DNA polymerase I-like protein with 3'-5' exonuclease and polymerase domains
MLLPLVPETVPIAVDTETSGLFIDGDPGKAPRARVSVVSASWRDPHNGNIVDQVWPFDQGWLEGKPGRCGWSKRGRPGHYPLPPMPAWRRIEQLDHISSMGIYPDYDEGAFNFPPDQLPELLSWLSRHPLIMHHAKFDCHILATGHRLDESTGLDLSRSVFWDTQHANGLLWPLEPSSLKPTAKRLWGEEEGDAAAAILTERKRQGKGLTWRYDILQWKTLEPYAAMDSNQTLRLWEWQQAHVDEGAVWKGFDQVRRLELAMFRTLFDMERRGIGFDKEGAYAEYDKMVGLLEEAKESLPFKATDPAARAFFGVPSVAAPVVRELLDHPDPKIAQAAHAWHNVKSFQSAMAKWYRGWPAATGKDGRLRTNYRQMRIESDRPGGKTGGAISGRLSVERVQLQAIPHAYQIPKDIVPIRKFFRDKLGHTNWELDLAQAEVRVGTSISRCLGMLEVLKRGTDVHGQTATVIWGIEPGDPKWEQLRNVAKRLTFAILYGAGIDTMRAQIMMFTGVEYGRVETRKLRDDYNNAFPEMSQAAWLAQQRADRGMGGPGYLTFKVTGRRREFGYGERTHKAWNAVIQGTVAELMKLWMVEVNERWPGWLLLQIHDSLVLEVPNDQENELDKICDLGVQIFNTRLVEIGGLDVPFAIDRKRWADAK